MILKFPELNGGTFQGLNDAGVENFLGAIEVYLSRECGQNTADAPGLGVETVRLEFDKMMIPDKEIPAIEDIRSALRACLEKSEGKRKETEFFEQAIDVANRSEIPVLRIADYGTTGLTGDDLDEKGRWFGLVKSQGVSNKKDATAGGAFGIGKSSPFAASRFRTVFYGTKTESGQVALQGVSRLMTHKNADGRLTQATGFIGNFVPCGGPGGDPIFAAIRQVNDIPAQFRRNEPGTDIWVIGYRSGLEWSNDLIRSILANFWPAIQRGKIRFRVDAQEITQANLAELIAKQVGHEDFETHHFFKAVQNKPTERTLKYTGRCQLYLTASSPDLPRKICMARQSGMRIYDYMPKACRVPFSGLFICTDSSGNQLLRELEPPKHDTWDPKRSEDGSGKVALDEIKLWIREEVKKLNPFFSGKDFNESDLAKYVPDEPTDEPMDMPQTDTGTSQEQDLEPKPKQEDIATDPTTMKPLVILPGKKKRQQNGNGGGGDGGGGGRGGPTEVDVPELMVRSYRSGNGGEYELVLRSDKDFTGRVSVQAVGEDGASEFVKLMSARLKGAEEAFVVNNSSIEGIELTKDAPLRITVHIDAIEKRSLTAIPII